MIGTRDRFSLCQLCCYFAMINGHTIYWKMLTPWFMELRQLRCDNCNRINALAPGHVLPRSHSVIYVTPVTRVQYIVAKVITLHNNYYTQAYYIN